MKISINKVLNIVLALIVLVLVYQNQIQKPEDNTSPQFEKVDSLSDDANTKKVDYGNRLLIYPKPAVVIGSYNADSVPNIMTAAWAGVCNSYPPKIAVSMRPATLSYHNLTLNQAFTVNVPSTRDVAVVDFVGRFSGHDMNKFERLGLTALQADSVYAPYIAEFPISIECRITEMIDLGSHRQFIGEVINTKVAAQLITADGKIDVKALDPLTYTGGYYGLGSWVAKPGEAWKVFEEK